MSRAGFERVLSREFYLWGGGPAGCETQAYVRRKGLWPTCGVPVCVIMWGLRWWPQAYGWLPVRDESGGFSFSFASFAKFSQSFEAAVGEVVGSARPTVSADNKYGGSPRLRAVRKDHGAGGRGVAGRAAPVFESETRARLRARRVCVSRRARAVWVRSGAVGRGIRGGVWPCWPPRRRRAWRERRHP